VNRFHSRAVPSPSSSWFFPELGVFPPGIIIDFLSSFSVVSPVAHRPPPDPFCKHEAVSFMPFTGNTFQTAGKMTGVFGGDGFLSFSAIMALV